MRIGDRGGAWALLVAAWAMGAGCLRIVSTPDEVARFGTTSGVAELPLASPEEVRFVALGDTGRGDPAQRSVADAIAAHCRTHGCDFVLLLGDNIYDRGVSSAEDPQFQEKFERPYAAIPAPFYAVLGNHDYGDLWALEVARGRHQVEYSQRSARWRMPAAYWRLRAGPVELFGTDTTLQLGGDDGVQRREVAEWIAASSAPWKLAAGHHPYRSNGDHGDAGRFDGIPGSFRPAGGGVKRFYEEVLCGRVDLALAGHDHSRQWLLQPCGGRTELVISGGGSLTGGLRARHPARFQAATPGFLYVRATGETLEASFVGVDGAVQFSRSLTRWAGDRRSPAP